MSRRERRLASGHRSAVGPRGSAGGFGTLGAACPTQQPYAQVDFVDFEEVETRTMEEAVRERMEARMNERVTNVSADAGPTHPMKCAVPAHRIRRCRRKWRRNCARLSRRPLTRCPQAARIPMPQAKGADGRDEPLEQYEGWDERVAGQVTAEYELDGRKALNLSIPGYRCRGGGVVLLSIVVSPGGDVLEASVVSAVSEGGEAMSSCLETESLRSVRQCRFQSKADAPRRQAGTLTYRFIAQ